MKEVTPHQLDLWSSNFAELYNALEGEIIRQLIKRLSNGKTDILEWQAQALKDLHLFNKDVAKLLSQVTGVAESEIVEMMESAGEQMIKDVDAVMVSDPKPMPSNIDNIMRNYANQAWGDIDNLVNQTLVTTNYGYGTAAKAYTQVLNRTQALFNAGMVTFDQAIQKAVEELAQQGIKSTFVDKGGHTWSMERYVRTVLKSTLGNTYNQLRTERAAEYGVYTVLVSSHAGARKACSKIQGRVADTRRPEQLPIGWKYKSIYDPYWGAHYGEAGGHRGVNCRHLWFIYIPGVTTNNQPDFDEKLNAKVAKDQARQRLLERRVVKYKKNKLVADELGNIETSAKYSQLIRTQQKALRDLVSSSEYLSRDYKREKVYTPLNTLLKDFRFDEF